MALTPGDEYALHQTPEPIAYAGHGRNFYDRFFFNGYTLPQANDATDPPLFFGAALGVYPQLNVMDAAFSFTLDGTQYSLRASKEMGMNRLDTQVGPITIDIIQPFVNITLRVNAPEHELSVDLTCTGLHSPLEEPRFISRNGGRTMMDSTRMTQNVYWEGTINFRGTQYSFDAKNSRGTRDRSWGVRNIGQPDPAPLIPAAQPQFYWIWAPTCLRESSLFWHTNDYADGVAWNRSGAHLKHDLSTDIAKLPSTQEFGGQKYSDSEFTVAYQEGTRRIKSLDVRMVQPLKESGSRPPREKLLRVRPYAPVFHMQGIGYLHPEYGHGIHLGNEFTHFESGSINAGESQIESGAMHYLHIQVLSEVEVIENDEVTDSGITALEQLLIGDHASGLTGLLDPAH